LAEAARYLRLPPATLRSWVIGGTYATGAGRAEFKPILRLPGGSRSELSFNNLVEAHVLRALRTDHRVKLQAVRDSLRYAERELGIKRLLLSSELRTNAGALFLDRYGELIELSSSGQLAMRRLLEAYLKRVEWDKAKIPVRLYPFVRSDSMEGPKPIVIDSAIAFGRPIIARKSVSTAVIVDRMDAGESVAEIAKDYDLTQQEVEEAVVYERAA